MCAYAHKGKIKGKPQWKEGFAFRGQWKDHRRWEYQHPFAVLPQMYLQAIQFLDMRATIYVADLRLGMVSEANLYQQVD